MNNCKVRVRVLYDTIINNKGALIELLSTIETLQTALDEYSRCVKYLSDFCTSQKDYVPKNLNGSAAAYLPLNLPLYSFLLFPFTLSLACETVFYRPPMQLWSLHRELFSIMSDCTPSIHLCECSRKLFMDDYVSNADVVVYTGRFENVQEIREGLSEETLLIFNGSALNPIVVTETADIEKSVECTIQARLYNSGQDCMAPAGIFVHKHVASKFCLTLQKQIDGYYKVNGNWDRNRIGQMLSEKCYEEDISFLSENQKHVTYGGQTLGDKFLSPTVFYYSKYTEGTQNILYAPFFSIYEYVSEEEIIKYLSTEHAQRYMGYVSIFGAKTPPITQRLIDMGLIALINCTLYDHENGNREFGGYGIGCSFVAFGGNTTAQPILLLREIAKWRNYNVRIS